MLRTIIVRKAVLAAAQKLQELSNARDGTTALDLAEMKMNQSHEAMDSAGVKFWRSVWVHLMQINYAPDEIQIIEGANDELGMEEECEALGTVESTDRHAY